MLQLSSAKSSCGKTAVFRKRKQQEGKVKKERKVTAGEGGAER
jgi:hypothetical protein